MFTSSDTCVINTICLFKRTYPQMYTEQTVNHAHETGRASVVPSLQKTFVCRVPFCEAENSASLLQSGTRRTMHPSSDRKTSEDYASLLSDSKRTRLLSHVSVCPSSSLSLCTCIPPPLLSCFVR